MKLILASASPRRRELLATLGVPFEVRPADLDETQREGEDARAYVERLAREKGASLSLRSGERAGERGQFIILSADTSVVVDGNVLGKPGHDAALGAAMLRRLAGRAHEVMTGVAVQTESGVTSRVIVSVVHFRPLSEEEISAYVASGEGADKAGGYALQGEAGAFITHVDGSRTNVIGLPVEETAELLRSAGVPLSPTLSPLRREREFAVRLSQVEARVAAACTRAGRARSEVTLLAVSKLHPAAAIQEAYAAGLRHFGENYAQELRDKHTALAALPGLVWHAIGPVQPKNAKYVAKAATFFHAVDRLDTVAELAKRREGAPLQCLIEVNVAGEASKAGVSPDALPDFIAAVRAAPSLALVGLSAMPPLTDEPEDARPHFRALAQLAKTHGLTQLSMGTTGDFEVAIEEGATIIRVGTALFGARQYHSSDT